MGLDLNEILEREKNTSLCYESHLIDHQPQFKSELIEHSIGLSIYGRLVSIPSASIEIKPRKIKERNSFK